MNKLVPCSTPFSQSVPNLANENVRQSQDLNIEKTSIPYKEIFEMALKYNNYTKFFEELHTAFGMLTVKYQHQLKMISDQNLMKTTNSSKIT